MIQIEKCGCAEGRFPIDDRYICNTIKKPDAGLEVYLVESLMLLLINCNIFPLKCLTTSAKDVGHTQ